MATEAVKDGVERAAWTAVQAFLGAFAVLAAALSAIKTSIKRAVD